MTDRVIEIRLMAPRPNLLQLLAQPEFALVRDGQGSGPFQLGRPAGADFACSGAKLPGPTARTAGARRSSLQRRGRARRPSRDFAAGRPTWCWAGPSPTCRFARRVEAAPQCACSSIRSPGLFGLAPARKGGPLADPDLRRCWRRRSTATR